MRKHVTFKLLNIADDIKKNWWVLLLSVLLGLMSAYLYQNKFSSLSRSGEASVTLRSYDRQSQISNVWSGTAAAKDVSTNLKSIFENKELWNSVISDFPYDSLPDMEVSSQEDSGIVTVTAKSSSSALSYRAIEKLLEAYPDIAKSFNSRAAIEVINAPDIVQKPNTGGAVYFLFPLILFLLTFLLIVLISVIVDRVKKFSDLEEIFSDSGTFMVKIGKSSCTALKNGTPLWLDNTVQAIRNRLSADNKIFLMTSAEKMSGKPRVVLALAEQLNRSGIRTAVLSDNPSSFGSSGSLFQNMAADDLLKIKDLTFPVFLDVSGSGPESDRLCRAAAQISDCVLWDYHDLNCISVDENLSGSAESVLFFVNSDLSSFRKIAAAAEIAEISGKKITGVILNRAGKRTLSVGSGEASV